MLRPRVATHASSSSMSSSSAEGEVWSPTIVNPSLSAFDRLKEKRVSSSDGGEHHAIRSGSVLRGVSAGPLDLQDLVLMAPVDDRGSGDRTEPQDQEYGEEDDDEDALKALFFRQQQLEKKLLQEREPNEHDDVDQFLTSELRFDIPANASDLSVATSAMKKKKNTSASRSIKSSSERTTALVDPSMSALTASMHEQFSLKGSHHRRRRQSNALLPDGVLHLWIYQARQLSFRSHFESMYDRHGLHIRCYLSWRHEYLSDVFESRRNVGGNMKNPIWRRDDDHSRNSMRGHFSIPLGSRSSPASLPANTEVVIEIVCGILVVSAAKVSLLEFFQDRSSRSSTEDDDDQDNARNTSGIVSCSPEWYPLIGQDSGLLEMGLEFIPASAFDDDDDDDDEAHGDLAFVLVKNNNEDEYEDELALLSDDSSLFQNEGDDEEPQVQDPSELNAFEEEYMQLEQRTLTRKMRFECPELREQFEVLEAQNAESDSEHSTSGVVVSNNGKTTMYIPSQCQPKHERNVCFPVQSPDRQLTTNAPNTALVATRNDLAQIASPSPPRSDETMMDEQVFDLFRFGIANDQTNCQNGMHRTSSCASQISRFSWGNSEYSRSDASMFSRKASTCATEVLAYNELIQDMESSLEAQAAEAQRGRRRRSSASSTAIPKVDGILRLAAPTSEPHPITAAMGVIPNKSSLKKSSFMRTYDASKSGEQANNDYHQASSVRETTSKGVVLFDLKSIPERLRVGFERSVSEERMTGNKKDMNLGRRRSLPVNSLTSPDASQPVSLHATHNRNFRGGRSSRPVAIEEHKDEKVNNDASQEQILRRKRSSSMYSLTDLHGRRGEANAPENGAQRQQQQHEGSRASTRRFRGSTPRTKQRHNSNASNLVTVGGAVLGVGKFINVGSVPGVVRYVGPANFASGTWIGIELCEKKGKNNGTVKGIEYFSCAPDHGIFIRANRLDIST